MTKHHGYGRQGRQSEMAIRGAAVVLVAVLGSSGCTQKNERDTSGLPADRICGSSVDGAAVSALKRLSGTDEFIESSGPSESSGTGDAAAEGAFTVERAAETLHGAESERTKCTIYPAGDDSGHPLVDIGFEASDTHPDLPGRNGGPEPKKDQVFYGLGAFAVTNGDFGASLFFRCVVKDAQGDTSYIKATMFSTADLLREDSTSADRMAVLNSVSRHMATELGCTDTARLPAKVPAPERA